MSTKQPYNLDYMLPGVLNAALNAGHCRSCHRKTDSLVEGHDGYCPVPAVETLRAQLAAVHNHIDAYAAIAKERDGLRAERDRLKLIIELCGLPLPGLDAPTPPGA